ncbi:YqaA family protein [Limobrevibacterium gyesilva]|uniref:DedA family protein n=1 Tax=Limobrevibacterium gyesilva TaxID=2991712 RepID=A0AA42CJN6_9PROT|nr:YqaA family protein [Limobrevibacterium gyesilva]MCW3477077.1 DedA family protein [Limobrevibacterium gyesilva]
MLQRLYQRVLALSASRHAPVWLAIISFAESSFFPIPPDALLVPMALARPDRAWRFATICTVASVVGGVLGYLIGYALFDVIATPLLHAYHYEAAFERFKQTYAEYGLWVILVKGLTPIPYKIVTIASGAASFSFPVFVAASIVTRGARFFLLATLLHFYGDRVRTFIERRLTLVTTAIAAGIVGGFLVLRFL